MFKYDNEAQLPENELLKKRDCYVVKIELCYFREKFYVANIVMLLDLFHNLLYRSVI